MLTCSRCKNAVPGVPSIAGFCVACEVEYFAFRDELPLRWWFVLGASVPCGLSYLLLLAAQQALRGGSGTLRGLGLLAPIAFVMAVIGCGKAAVFLRCWLLQRRLLLGDDP